MKKRQLIFVITAILFSCLAPLSAFAMVVPERPANQYVLDNANVLSDSVERHIIQKNEKLFRDTGAQIVIVAVDFVSGNDMEEYAYEILKKWEIGSERNNGVLFVMAVKEDKYWVMPGYGIENYLNTDMLMDIISDNRVEENFDAGDYEAAALGFFDDVNDRLIAYYDGYVDEYTYNEEEDSNYQRDSMSNSTKRIVTIIVIIAVISLLSRNSRSGGGGYRGGGGSFFRGMIWGSMMNSGRRSGWNRGGYGGHRGGHRGGFGGGSRGGFSGGGGFGGGGSSGGSGRSGGFSGGGGGGGTRGGGVGRK